jgi:hypothetical protein
MALTAGLSSIRCLEEVPTGAAFGLVGPGLAQRAKLLLQLGELVLYLSQTVLQPLLEAFEDGPTLLSGRLLPELREAGIAPASRRGLRFSTTLAPTHDVTSL